MSYFVYITTNLVNGKRYIGLCSTGRKNYLGSGVLLKKAIAKYGIENFKREILEICENKEDLRLAEIKWIEEFGAVESDQFYNLDKGGHGGGEPNSNRVKEYWSKLDSEQRRERLKNWISYDKSGANNPMYGRKRSADIKKVWDSRTAEYRNAIRDKTKATKLAKGQDGRGEKNPMYGRSAVTENNLKWYNINGSNPIYVTEGTQPEGYVRGRGKIGPRKRKQGKWLVLDKH